MRRRLLDGERFAARRRGRSGLVASLVLVTAALAAAGLGLVAADGERAEADRFSCAAGSAECAEARRAVVARLRDGGRPARSIDRFLDRVLPAGAGGSLVAARGAKRVYCRGFGMADRERSVPAGCDTVYDVMSMTKQFTAAAVLKLQMIGRLDVRDPIGKYIGPVPAGKGAITVRQLLTHTSGFIAALGGDYERLSRRDMVAGAMASKLRSPPGTEYHYSNLGYSLLAAIIERASGMGYEEFLAKRLFAGTGMSQTGYVLPDWKRRKVAVEYDPRGRSHGRPFDHPWAADGPYWNLRGNGGMLSTPLDMLRWHRALGGDEVLDRRSVSELFKPRVLEEEGGDTRYAYGWVIAETDEGPVAWHNGGNGWSYGELTRVLDDGVMVFWVTNRFKDKAEGWDFYRLGQALTRGVVKRVPAGRG